MFTFEDAESEDSMENKSITMAKVTKVVKELLCGRVPWVDEICPKMLKALDVVGLDDMSLQHHMEDRDNSCGVADRGGVSHSLKGRPESVF